MRKWAEAQLGTVFAISEDCAEHSWLWDLCEEGDYALAVALIVTGAV